MASAGQPGDPRGRGLMPGPQGQYANPGMRAVMGRQGPGAFSRTPQGQGMGAGLGAVPVEAPFTANTDTTTAVNVPQEPAPVIPEDQMMPDAGFGGAGYGTGGPLTPNPRPPGGYTGAGGRQFGRIMPGSGGPGPLRRA